MLCACVLFFPRVHLWVVDLIIKIMAVVAVFHMAQCLHMKEDIEYMIKTHIMPDMDKIIEKEYLSLALDENVVTTR